MSENSTITPFASLISPYLFGAGSFASPYFLASAASYSARAPS